MRRKKFAAVLLAAVLTGTLGFFGSAAAHEGEEQVVFGSSVYDGTYPVTAETEEDFPVSNSLLSAENGHLTVLLLMPDDSVDALFLGTAREAAAAPMNRWIQAVKNNAGNSTFNLPISVLDQKLCCASYSKKTKTWTDHTILFESSSLPEDAVAKGNGISVEDLKLEDGIYEVAVAMTGGSGRASIQSPTKMTVSEGKVTASIVWSSKNYDYMIVGDQKIVYDGKGEFSTFEIPVEVFDEPFEVTADTTAMSTPHEIQYRLTFDSSSVK